MSEKKRWTSKAFAAVATGAAAAVIGAWGTHFIGPRQQPVSLSVVAESGTPINESDSKSANEPTAETLLAQSRISFVDWQALVKQSLTAEQRQAIFERYRGERVTWEGYVDQMNRISPDNGGTSSSQFILAIYEDQETLASRSLGRAPALCLFPREAADALGALKRGQRVIVQGTFAATTLHGQLLGTRLYHCQLVVDD